MMNDKQQKPAANTPNEVNKNSNACSSEEHAAMMKQCEEYLNGWKRAKADYENLKKETLKQQGEFRMFAAGETVEKFLPLVDYFQYAFKQEIPKEYADSAWLKGIQHIESYLLKTLEDLGIKKMETVGKIFQPEYHDAVEQRESDRKSGTIVEEVSAGFMWNGKVFRHAKVKIAK